MEKHKEVGWLLVDSLTEALSTSKIERSLIIEKNIVEIELKLATQEELENEISFFVKTLHLLNYILPTIRAVHDIFFHVVPRLRKFRQVYHFAKDPIERTHANDKYLSRIFGVIRNPVKLED